uniref:Uncharacterized protein n=1 Tax=Parascaris equorum TaxID=6256 RepID=A0A914R7N3_PAREQ
MNIIDPSFLFELDSGPCVDKLAIGQQLSSWFENCSNMNGISSLGVVSDERAFHLKMCRLARKTANLRLADRHMRFHSAQRQAHSNGLMEVHPFTLSVFDLSLLLVTLCL